VLLKVTIGQREKPMPQPSACFPWSGRALATSGAEAKLEYLRELLEALSVISSTTVPTEDQIAVVAVALWKARGCPDGEPEEDWLCREFQSSSMRWRPSTSLGLIVEELHSTTQ
jgi:Protein of unknown function (DUF2934)